MQENWYPYDIVIETSHTLRGGYSLPSAYYKGNLYALGFDAVENLYTDTEVAPLTGEAAFSFNATIGTKHYFVDCVEGVSVSLKQLDITDASVRTLDTIENASIRIANYSKVFPNEDKTSIYWMYAIVGGTSYIREWDISGASGSATTSRANVGAVLGVGVEDDGTIHFGYQAGDTDYYWDEYTDGGGWVNLDSSSGAVGWRPGFGGYTIFGDRIYPPGDIVNFWDLSGIGNLHSCFLHIADGGHIEAIFIEDAIYYRLLKDDYTVQDLGSTAVSDLEWQNAILELPSLSGPIYWARRSNGYLATLTNRRRNIF